MKNLEKAIKIIVKLYLLLIFIVLLSSIAFAQEPAKYNFASLQEGNILNIPVGSAGIGKIFFYNADGNRVTHIRLEIVESPEWEIEIDPELHNQTFSMGGDTINVEESLFIEPSNLSNEPKEEEGVEYIKVGDRGYAPAKAARIIVNVPEDEKAGKRYNIVIRTTAFWLGQAGTAAISQSRDFNYEINTLSAGREVPVEEVEKENITSIQQPTQKLQPQPITGLIFANPVITPIIIILVLIIIFLLAVIFRGFRGTKKSRRSKAKR